MRNIIARRFQNQKASLALDVEALSRYEDLIDLSIGDTDFITDRRIIDAAYEDACAGATKYGDPQGDPELIAGIRKAWKEDFGQDLKKEEILITASSCLGMEQALLAIVDPGDEVIVFGPYFAVYRQQIQMAGGVCVEVITEAVDEYHIREERLRGAITEKTKAIIINNPTNPTGAAYDEADLALVARVCTEHDLVVIADEIYTRYLFEGEFVPIRTMPGMAERTITLNSFSKNFMMTGWRVGFIVAQPEVIRIIQNISNCLIYTTPSISQRAAIKALTLREEIQQAYISQYQERVNYVADRIAEIPYMTLFRPKGTFYIFPGIEKTGMSDAEFCDYALEQAHVLMSPGSAFGEAGKGHVRMACTAPMEKLVEAMDRLAALRF